MTSITLIYDNDVSGHHLDYLQFLVEYLHRTPEAVRERYVFVLNEAARERFHRYEPLVRFHYLSTTWIASTRQLPLLKSAAVEFEYIKNIAVQYQAQRLLLMHADAYQLEMGKVSLENTALKISAILFLPFRAECEDGSTPQARMKRAARGWRKGMQVNWMLRNPNVETIFFINDHEGVRQYNERFGKRFAHLPDPIDVNVTVRMSVPELKHYYQVPADKRVFLIYGHLSPRKNVPNIVAAFGHLTREERSKICLLVCGEPEAAYEKTLLETVRGGEKDYPEVTFVKKYEFFGPQPTHEVCALADVILIPYINFFSSSNVIGLASKYNKPLIAPTLGVMSELVGRYGLGQRVNPYEPKSIAAAMRYYLQHPTTEMNGARYLQDHAADVFCRKLLNL
jgi:glycosyltransferase involved in cell wall biosynthesis